MAYPRVGAATHMTTSAVATTVECHKQVRSWRLLRSLIELLIPTCNCTFVEDHQDRHQPKKESIFNYPHPPNFRYPKTNIITGTIFGYKKGKVNFCIQTNSKTCSPTLLLELALPTTVLAKEMQGGFLRIALESSTRGYEYSPSSGSLLSTPVWAMYCNGRRVGYAVKRRPSKHDVEALRMMSSVEVGAGIVSRNNKEVDDGGDEDEIMYLRANFERVCGSGNSESFHLVDPDESIGQELSVFFYRSR